MAAAIKCMDRGQTWIADQCAIIPPTKGLRTIFMLNAAKLSYFLFLHRQMGFQDAFTRIFNTSNPINFAPDLKVWRQEKIRKMMKYRYPINSFSDCNPSKIEPRRRWQCVLMQSPIGFFSYKFEHLRLWFYNTNASVILKREKKRKRKIKNRMKRQEIDHKSGTPHLISCCM